MNSPYGNVGTILAVVTTAILIRITVANMDADPKHSHVKPNRPYEGNPDLKRREGCTVKKIYAIIRHGTPVPYFDDAEIFDDIKKEIASAPNSVLPEDVKERFREWNPRKHAAETLSNTGVTEITGIGERFKQLLDNIDEKLFVFAIGRGSGSASTAQSMEVFMRTIFAGKTISSEEETNPVSTYLEEFIKKQKNFEDEPALTSNILDSGAVQFYTSHNYKNMLLDHFKGIRHYWVFLSIYKAYGKEMAALTESVWEELLDARRIEAMDEAVDFAITLIYGKSDNRYKNLPCLIYREINDFFEGRVKSDKRYVFYFVEDHVIIAMLAFIGLYEPTWRESRSASFASNLAYILYECGTVQHVEVVHQERKIVVPAFQEGDLNDFKDLLKDRISDQFCNREYPSLLEP